MVGLHTEVLDTQTYWSYQKFLDLAINLFKNKDNKDKFNNSSFWFGNFQGQILYDTFTDDNSEPCGFFDIYQKFTTTRGIKVYLYVAKNPPRSLTPPVQYTELLAAPKKIIETGKFNKVVTAAAVKKALKFAEETTVLSEEKKDSTVINLDSSRNCTSDADKVINKNSDARIDNDDNEEKKEIVKSDAKNDSNGSEEKKMNEACNQSNQEYSSIYTQNNNFIMFDEESNGIVKIKVQENTPKNFKKLIINADVVERADLNITDRILGSGGSAVVYLGKWLGSDVAVKSVTMDYTDKYVLREIKIMDRVKHESILPLMAVAVDLN